MTLTSSLEASSGWATPAVETGKGQLHCAHGEFGLGRPLCEGPPSSHV